MLPDEFDIDHRRASIQRLFTQSKAPLSEEVSRILVQSEHMPDSREIKSILLRFQAYAALVDVDLTEELTETLFLGDPEFRKRLGRKKSSYVF